jgi:ribulose-phosphate 3-epimerase
MSLIVAPSILSADFANLQRDVEMLNLSTADWIHVDIMDGIFVPNISFGLPVTQAIHQHAKKPLDVHLMIQQPDLYLEDFQKAGAAILTVHYEACTHLNRTCAAIRNLGMKAGVAINPHTPVDLLTDILGEIDLVLIMSVNPGFGGQKFIGRTYDKIRSLKRMIAERNLSVLIEVDGGVNTENASALAQAGADAIVAGNAVFSSANPAQVIEELKK